MRTIIIEDEQLAVCRLEMMVKTIDPSIETTAKLRLVEDSIEWFKANKPPDLIFPDIQPEGGLILSIFGHVKVNSPNIKNNLKKVIKQYIEWGEKQQMINFTELYKLVSAREKSYHEHFSVTVGQNMKSIGVKNIAYFFSNCGITFVEMNSKGQYSVDQSLDNLKDEPDPKQFFRVNRLCLADLTSNAGIRAYPKSWLKQELTPCIHNRVFVSLYKVVDFLKWVDGRINQKLISIN